MRNIPAGLAGLALVLVLAASCGSDDAEATPAVVIDTPTADDDTPDATSDEIRTDEEMALAFAQCMRDNGVPEFEDPVVNADGSIELVRGGAGGGGVDPGDSTVRGAIDTCRDLVEGASFLPGADRDRAELEDDLLAMAQCLRARGLDVDDPDLDAFGPGNGGDAGGGGPFGPGFDASDPANAEAIEDCQLEVFGSTTGFGRGRN